jgi:hypothetical protein
VDQLPTGPSWSCEIVKVDGDRVGDGGETMAEELELWMRDPVECVKELVGNPAFKKLMSFVPERVYADENGMNRIYDEMWTADWWWKTQVSVTIFLISQQIITKILLFVGQATRRCYPRTVNHCLR